MSDEEEREARLKEQLADSRGMLVHSFTGLTYRDIRMNLDWESVRKIKNPELVKEIESMLTLWTQRDIMSRLHGQEYWNRVQFWATVGAALLVSAASILVVIKQLTP